MSATTDDLLNEKKKILCHECGTVSFIKINRLPAHIREITCPSCGASIPLLDRLMEKTNPQTDNVRATGQSETSHDNLDILALYSASHTDAEEAEDDSGWLISFSDVMTQLLAFFILLAAMSSIDRHKFDQAMASISQALGGKPVTAQRVDSNGAKLDIPKDMLGYLQGKIKIEQNSMDQLRNTLKERIDQQGLSAEFAFHTDSDGLVVIMQSEILFDEGSAELKERLKPILRDIGQLLAPLPNEIVIEGHTDNKPIATRQYPSNWELSMQRAINVVRFYTEEENILNPRKIIAAGVAAYRPRYNINSDEAYRNRRIEIHIRRESSDIFDRLLHSR